MVFVKEKVSVFDAEDLQNDPKAGWQQPDWKISEPIVKFLHVECFLLVLELFEEAPGVQEKVYWL